MTPEERAAAVFGELRERLDRGERIDEDDALRAHPDIADPLRRQFEAMRLAEGFLRRSPRAAEQAALVGRSLGKWRLESVLGSGGMGTVYAAEHGGAAAAVKVLHPHLAARGAFVERFLREADAGRRVRHPNVVATLEAGTTQAGGVTVHYLVMERVLGRTLRALLDESGRLPEALCRHVGREAASALAAIHAEGFVHRDVKPENVIVTPDHLVKLMDLGVARLRDEQMRLSNTGAFVGSVRYAAPEQFGGPAPRGAASAAKTEEGADAVDGRADLYALGLTLYEAATGAHPFPDEEFHVVLRRQLTATPRRAGEMNPQLSAFFEELLVQLLAKDRERRPAGAELVARILDEGEDSAWWRDRARALREETRRPLRRMRVPRETAVYGRDQELALLRSLYERTKEGDGRVALIEGEAGIGKSRLVDEFVARLARSGEDVNFLHGSYPPGGAATATGAFTRAYREHVGDDDTAVRATLPQAPLLAPAFAALLRGDLAPEGTEPLTKDSLQTVFVHATRTLAAERPTVVLIDDLHFAPDEGRALFAALAMAVPGHRVLLVGAARPTIDAKWLAQVESIGHASRIALARLGAKDLVLLLRDTLKSEHLAEELSARIAVKSDGNPFFVFEILRGLREGRFITKRSDGTWGTTGEIREIVVPSSVVELVQARVSDLARADRNLLEAASCAGFEFDPALVGDVLRMERIPLLQALGAIEKSHRLVRSAGRRFAFDHHQVMEVLYAGLSEPLREEYHAAIGAALEARAGAASKPPAELDGALCAALTDHFLRGAQGPRALRYLDDALLHFERAYLHGAAVDVIDRALGVPGLLAGRRRAEVLLVKASRIEQMGSRRAEERTSAEEAIALADAATDAALSARARSRAARHFLATSRFAEAEPLLLAAEAMARAAGDKKTESDVAKGLGTVAINAGRIEEAARHFARQLELCRQAGHRRGEAYATGNVGLALSQLGRPAESREQHERHLAIARETGDLRSEAAATAQLGHALLKDGRYEEAEAWFERARSIWREVGDRIYEGQNAMNLGAIAGALGRYAAAMTQFAARLALCEESGDRRGAAVTVLNQGVVLRTCGRSAEAREALTRGLSIAQKAGVRIFETSALHALAMLDDDEGDAAAATLRFDEALELCRRIGQRRTEAEVLVARGAFLVRQGRTGDARADLEAALSLPQEARDPSVELLATAWLARMPGGDAGRALAALASGDRRVSVHDAMEARFVIWQATGDRAHLAESSRRLAYLVDNAPADWRESMLANVPLHRDVTAAARASGL